MRFKVLFFIIFTPFLLLPGLLKAEVIQFTPVIDNTLFEDEQGDVSNGSGNYLFFGKVGSTGGELLRRALVKFDVSAIPVGARIDEVTVSFEINMAPLPFNGGTASLHRMAAAWGEGSSAAFGNEGPGIAAEQDDATWLHGFYPGINWSVPGGDFDISSSASIGYGGDLGPLVFASTEKLRADVTSWVANSSVNHGWVLRGNETDALSARRVFSRESTGLEVPLLTVTYTIPSPTDNLVLTEVASTLNSPVAIANANDGSGRLFIVQRSGEIRIFDTLTQTLLATPYLDLSAVVDDAASEQGLLGLAFHPEFASNRRFYVYYIRDPGPGADLSVIAMYQQNSVSANSADVSGTVLMEFEQDSTNHNGGDMHFGEDGYLYIATGDGGGSNDTFNNAQDITELKGKILRIDVDGTPPGGGELCGLNPAYGIPPGNAFPGTGNGCDEILHLGLRNPWKFSFDAQTGDMFIGDVGQGQREEVDFAANGASGLNFGWPCREGTVANLARGDASCPNPVDPIFDYPRLGFPNECAITGGYVYRGSTAGFTGYYVYGDYCSAKIWLAKQVSGTWTSEEWTDAAPILNSISAFGQDEQCELYVADLSAGKVYRIDDTEMVYRSGFEALRCQ